MELEKLGQKLSQEQPERHKMVRILSEDIEGNVKLYPGLTRIKGISWTLSKAICVALSLDQDKEIGSLTDKELKDLIEFIKNPKLKSYILNRRVDIDTGEDKHLVGVDLELQKEFDIKRLKKIKSYRGHRHMTGLPSRGQRTRSNFRRNRAKGAGIKKKVKNKK